MQKTVNDIIIFLFVASALILVLVVFIVTILYLYRKKQTAYYQNLETLKLDYEKNLLKSHVEVQEQTIQHISREIHDNISLSLTLAKLHLNTLNMNEKVNATNLINSSVNLISKSINDLSDISKSMNADIISQQGLIDALKNETTRIQKAGLFVINISIRGNPEFMNAQKELVIFRIVQEAFNNVIKHSEAKNVLLDLNYINDHIEITIQDDGKGFDLSFSEAKMGAGLKNMKTRAKVFNGNVNIESEKEKGTKILISIPF
jgi:two-component system, NarL family, sensor kinase